MKNILDYLGIKKKKNVNTTAQEVPTQVSEEERIRRELMEKEYCCAYVFRGVYEKTIEVDGKTITYEHQNIFLDDSKYPLEITKVIRLTGENLSGKPITIDNYRREHVAFGKEYSGWWNYFDDEGHEYRLYASSYDKAEKYITGYELNESVKKHNTYYINWELKKIAKQEEVDAMFKD